LTGPIRVMLVDDHALVRGGLERLLAPEDDIEVVASVESGRDALEQLLEVPPDIILMDVSMPGMDGVATTREVLRRRPETIIVMLTSYADDEMVMAAIDAGAAGYLLKDG
jgi:NarL family two-component system response regulator LiaR